MFVSSLYMGTTRYEAFETLRQFVIAERTRLQLSQRELAKAGKISHSIIARLEAGQVPSMPKPAALEGIARGLRIPYEVLDRIVRCLPPEDADAQEAELIALWEKVPEDRKEAALRMLRGLAE